jgi:poly [ADP-ribose] polymerase 2/3/4
MGIIDEYCKVGGTVLDPYSCVLNQTDIEANKNKYYIMQIIETKTPTYELFVRYGRIGEPGKCSVDTYKNKSDAVAYFTKQFRSKTSNTFGKDFSKKAGKYFLAEMEKPKDDEIKKDDDKDDTKKDNLDDKIEDRLKYFLDLISNEKMLADTLVKLNIDAKKMPLGKISNTQLDKAADLLKKLKVIVDKYDTKDSDSDSDSDSDNNSKNKKKAKKLVSVIPKDVMDEVKQLSSEYYTLVPCVCGRRKPPPLENSEIVDKYEALVDELKNVHITYTIIKNSNNNLNRLTNVYDKMSSKITSMDKSCKMYQELEKYVANTHAPTHYCKLSVVDIYELDKDSNKVYDQFAKNMKNKMLLFHGSPIANWCSIIKNGLLLDPSKLGVKITGKMFGYGIYWANSISKSFNYCGADSSNNTAVLAIGEVALGDMYEKYTSDWSLSQAHLDKLKKNSTWGKGQSTPESITTIDGVGIPNGKLAKPKKNPPSGSYYSLLYDEFIIYNPNQYKIKYLMVVKNTK